MVRAGTFILGMTAGLLAFTLLFAEAGLYEEAEPVAPTLAPLVPIVLVFVAVVLAIRFAVRLLLPVALLVAAALLMLFL